MTQYRLNENEEKSLEKWLNKRDVKRAIKHGASVSFTFCHGSGIGRTIWVKLQFGVDRDGNRFELGPLQNITDYESW